LERLRLHEIGKYFDKTMNYIGFISALIASVVWGLVYNIDQKILLKSSPITMFFVGSIINIIILVPLFFISKESAKDIISIDRNQFCLLFVSQALVIVAGLAILYAIKYLGAPIASVFEISYPLFVAAFYFSFFGGTLNKNFWIGSTLIFIGGLIVANNS